MVRRRSDSTHFVEALCLSECEPQRELHEARRGQRRTVLPKLIWRVGERRLGRSDVITHRVCYIECLPTELESPLLAEREILAQACIDIEYAIACKVVADAGFAWPIRAKCILRRCWIGKNVRTDAGAVDDRVLRIRRLGERTVRFRVAFDVPISCPCGTVINRDGQPTCPAEQAREMPTSN